MAATPRHIRVFISSPGDVPDERRIAAKVVNDLPFDPLLKGRITTEVVAWDQPGSATPMLATMTPQEAINQGMPKPADCDLVITIFWARMGTPLPAEYTKADGSRFQSGTEWEYLNGVDETVASARRGERPSVPQVIVYRRTAEPMISLRDADRDEKLKQLERVDAFFKAFTNPDGSIQRGYNPYATPEEFRVLFENHMKKLIGQLLESTRAKPATPDAPSPAIWHGSPFPGLRAFTPDDEPIFYGRGAETDALVGKLRASRFVAVVGASGSGKSSLVGAGLLPRLAGNSLEGSKDWLLPGRVGDDHNRLWVGLRFTPGESGSDPFLALANRIAERLGQKPRELATDLAAAPESFPAVIAPLFVGQPDWAEALIFIDQFEELFTQVDSAKVAPFIQLLKAATDSARLHVVVTLRADFYPRCVENATLAALLQSGTFPLAAPGSVALGEMIGKPADRAGLHFEDGLIQRILEDTGSDPGALALMAYLLDELYKSGHADGQLTFAEYKRLDGVQGAIGKRAEEVVQKLTAGQQQTLPRLFSEIVDVDGRGRATRRRADLSRFGGDADGLAAIDRLTAERLLVQTGGVDQVSTVEVAHEALLREWDRLASWIGTAQADLLLRRQLEQAALDLANATAADKAAYLLVGGRLVEAQKWRTRYPNERAETLAFIAASEVAEGARLAEEVHRKQELADAQTASEHSAVRARSRTRIATIVGVAAIVLVIAAAVAFLSAQHETQAANTVVGNANATLTPIPLTLTAVAQVVQSGQALNESLRLAAAANGILDQNSETTDASGVLTTNYPGEPQTAALLAVRGLTAAYSPQADAALVKALDQTQRVRVLNGHTGSVSSVAFSLDGRYALTGSDDGTARLWDVATGQTVHVLSGHTSFVRSVAFSPDGRYALTGSDDHTARLWEVGSAQTVRVLSGHTRSVTSVAFSPDGHYALTGSDDGTARLWEVSSGLTVRVLRGHTSYVYSVAFSPDGRYALTGSDDRTARLWEVATGQTVRVLSGHTSYVFSVAFSLDGRYALTGSYDNTARLWEVDYGAFIAYACTQLAPRGADLSAAERTLYGLADNLPTCPQYAPPGTLVPMLPPTMTLFPIVLPHGTALDTPTALHTFPPTETRTPTASSTFPGILLTFTPSSTPTNEPPTATAPLSQTMTATQTPSSGPSPTDSLTPSLTLIPSQTPTLIPATVVITPIWAVGNGPLIASPTTDLSTLTPSSTLPPGTPSLTPSETLVPVTVVITPRSKVTLNAIPTLAIPTITLTPSITPTLTPTITPTPIPGQLARYTSYRVPVGSLAFSPDGRTVLLTGQLPEQSEGQNFAVLWDRQTHQEIRRLQGHSNYVISVAFSADGKFVLTGSRDTTAILWDVATGQALRTFKGKHTDWVSGVAFAPDGKTAVTAGKDGQVWLWDAQTGEPIRAFNGHTAWVNTIAFSGDGKYILTSSDDNSARLFDTATGSQIQEFDGSGEGINVAALSTDGRYAAAGDEQAKPNLVRVWDTTHAQTPIATFKASSSLSSLSFLPDDESLLVTDYQGNVILWNWKQNQVVWRFTMPSYQPAHATLSPDRQTLAVGDSDGLTLFDVRTLGGVSPTAVPTFTNIAVTATNTVAQ